MIIAISLLTIIFLGSSLFVSTGQHENAACREEYGMLQIGCPLETGHGWPQPYYVTNYNYETNKEQLTGGSWYGGALVYDVITWYVVAGVLAFGAVIMWPDKKPQK
jgi:hypothetical protein